MVAYVIDEATDEVAATVREAVRLARELHVWEGATPSGFDAVPDGSPRTVGVGLRVTGALPAGDRPGVVRLFDHLVAVSKSLGVCFEVQLDERPLGLIVPEGIQPWVADALREAFGLTQSDLPGV